MRAGIIHIQGEMDNGALPTVMIFNPGAVDDYANAP